MTRYLFVVLVLLFQTSFQVTSLPQTGDHNTFNNDPLPTIPLSCWQNAKRRFTIGHKWIWGPQLWHSLHCTALNYPNHPTQADKQNYKSFYENVHRIIPCRLCAAHYQENVVRFDLDKYTDSRMDLFRFTVQIHNLVNQQLAKTQWSLEDALALYQESCSQCEQTPTDLQALVDGLKPEMESSDAQPMQQDSQQNKWSFESIISEIAYGALHRLGLFLSGIAVATICLFVFGYI